MENEIEDSFNTLAKKLFNINYLFPYQRLVVSNILAAAANTGETLSRQIVILPTGYGKSLCYMMPAVMIEKPTIVLSPLVSLVQDQARRLTQSGISFSLLTGSLTKEEKKNSVLDIQSGKSKILLTNPESLIHAADKFTNYISHIVIDEAHTIPEWGETFRDALLETSKIIDIIKPDCVTAFTATATPLILGKIKSLIFGNSDEKGNEEQVNIIEGNPDRPNLFYSVIPSICPNRDLTELCRNEEKPLVIFCSSRNETEMTARMLRKELSSNDIFFYHAGLEKEEKKKIENWFFSSKTGILTATCAYGLGIDKSDIRTILHKNPPQSVEAYLQEAGRAGRDGQPSRAVLLALPFSRKHHPVENPDTGTLPSDSEIRAKQMENYTFNTTICRREKLLSFFSAGASHEQLACSGCDKCSGKQQKLAAGEGVVISLIKANYRKLNIDDITTILSSPPSAAVKYKTALSYGALHNYKSEEIKEAINNLENQKKIRKGKYLWKNLYSV